METAVNRLYEGMFLVDSALAAADWKGMLAVIENILKRADAEVVAMRKWQERRLAYEVDHKTRGTYILCYFKADGSRIAGIEKDVQLSEQVMRVLVLSTEDRPPLVVEEDVAGAPKEEDTRTGERAMRAAAEAGEDRRPAVVQEDIAGAPKEEDTPDVEATEGAAAKAGAETAEEKESAEQSTERAEAEEASDSEEPEKAAD